MNKWFYTYGTFCGFLSVATVAAIWVRWATNHTPPFGGPFVEIPLLIAATLLAAGSMILPTGFTYLAWSGKDSLTWRWGELKICWKRGNEGVQQDCEGPYARYLDN